MKKHPKNPSNTYETDKLNNLETRERFQDDLRTKISEGNTENETPNENWKRITKECITAANTILGKKENNNYPLNTKPLKETKTT